MNHIDQEAELYALGMLDDDERARIDEHLRGCDACTRAVGTAEAAVVAVLDATQRTPQRRVPRWPFAVAAAFAIAAAGLLGENLFLHGALDNDGTVLATMVNSHFDHEQFQTPQGAPLGAKAIYERHGKWYEILLDGTPSWHVVFVRPDGTRDPVPEAFARRGAASVVLAVPPAAVRTIELEDPDGHVVGTVKPVLAEKE
jgi:hypothetical protein